MSGVSFITARIAYSSTNKTKPVRIEMVIVQELCESRGGRPGLSVLTSLLVSVDLKLAENHVDALVSACP